MNIRSIFRTQHNILIILLICPVFVYSHTRQSGKINKYRTDNNVKPGSGNERYNVSDKSEVLDFYRDVFELLSRTVLLNNRLQYAYQCERNPRDEKMEKYICNIVRYKMNGDYKYILNIIPKNRDEYIEFVDMDRILSENVRVKNEMLSGKSYYQFIDDIVVGDVIKNGNYASAKYLFNKFTWTDGLYREGTEDQLATIIESHPEIMNANIKLLIARADSITLKTTSISTKKSTILSLYLDYLKKNVIDVKTYKAIEYILSKE